MRMDQASGFTAKDILENYSEEELARLIWDYGEERFAPR
jgi:16S rRNA (cytosine1402-N4)-methyltransferase